MLVKILTTKITQWHICGVWHSHIYFPIVYSTLRTNCYIALIIRLCVWCVQHLWQNPIFCHQTKIVKLSMACVWIWRWRNFWLCFCTKFLQCNVLNIHKSIAAIVFRFSFLCKTIYHFLGIITTTQKIEMLYAIWMLNGVCFHSYVPLRCVHMLDEMIEFLLLECINLCENQQYIPQS